MFAFLEERKDGKENAQQFAHLLVGFTLEGELEDTVKEGGKRGKHGWRETALVDEHAELDPDESDRHVVENGKGGQQLADENRWFHIVLGVTREGRNNRLRLLNELLIVNGAENC